MAEEGFYSVYQKYAKYYNFYFGRMMNPGRLKAIEFAALQPGEKVLEVGVGTGLSLPFYPNNVEVSGIDLSPEMLVRAKELVESEELAHVKKLAVMNAEHMEFPDNNFDVVMAMYVATVVSDPAQFAQEMKRVCKKNGRIIIVNHFYDPNAPVGKIAARLKPFAKYIGFRTDLTLEEFVRRSGLEIEKEASANVLSIHRVLLVRNRK
jgi:phosphatidylethanolamine/phosphatidyl-N-methylethanolamine N-methyltransferase